MSRNIMGGKIVDLGVQISIFSYIYIYTYVSCSLFMGTANDIDPNRITVFLGAK